jgi:hypothetical protein
MMQNTTHDLWLRPRLDRGADLTGQLAQLRVAGCEKVFRDKLTGHSFVS